MLPNFRAYERFYFKIGIRASMTQSFYSLLKRIKPISASIRASIAVMAGFCVTTRSISSAKSMAILEKYLSRRATI